MKTWIVMAALLALAGGVGVSISQAKAARSAGMLAAGACAGPCLVEGCCDDGGGCCCDAPPCECDDCDCPCCEDWLAVKAQACHSRSSVSGGACCRQLSEDAVTSPAE
jgi:hypothetical protein